MVYAVLEGYPFYPVAPDFVQDVAKIRTEIRGGKAYVDPATRADPQKRALFAAAKEVNNLTTNIGVRSFSTFSPNRVLKELNFIHLQTEIVGLQLSQRPTTR